MTLTMRNYARSCTSKPVLPAAGCCTGVLPNCVLVEREDTGTALRLLARLRIITRGQATTRWLHNTTDWRASAHEACMLTQKLWLTCAWRWHWDIQRLPRFTRPSAICTR